MGKDSKNCYLTYIILFIPVLSERDYQKTKFQIQFLGFTFNSFRLYALCSYKIVKGYWTVKHDFKGS